MRLVIESLGWTLVHSLWEGTLIWMALRAILVILARRSANTRCLVGCAALAFAVFAFGVTFIQVEFAAQRSVATSAGTVGVEFSISPQDSSRGAPSGIPVLLRTGGLNGAIAAVLPWVVFLWAAGCAWCSVKMAVGWRAAKRLAGTSRRPVSTWLEARCRELSRRLGIGRAVQIGESGLVDGPSVIGWLKPVIIVPISAFSGLEPAQIDGLLAHELAHIVRHDFVVNLLQSVCEVLFFYHPAIRAISQMIRAEREQACDDIAVELTGDPRGYAVALAKLEEARCPSLVLAANGGSSLLARVRRLLAAPEAPKRRFIAVSWITLAGIALAFAVLSVTPGITVRLLAAQPDSGPKPGPTLSAATKQIEAEFPYVIDFIPYQPPWSKFSPGDEIVITSVRGDRKHIEPDGRYLVEGTYTLASMESAGLSLSVTAPSPSSPGAISPVHDEEGIKVARGTGRFSLSATMRYAGSFHVSFNPMGGGESRGTIYFREDTPPQVKTGLNKVQFSVPGR